jgi:sulfotransferase famil protein
VPGARRWDNCGVPQPTPVTEAGFLPKNSFVLPELKMVYISVTKVACSSLSWMVADLAGEDLESFYSAPAAHHTRLMTIHRDRSWWKCTPRLTDLAPEQLAEVSRDNGWLIFAVVRDPWSRLWAGWQSKFLIRHAAYTRYYLDEPWFPRVPDKPEDVLEDWYRFVDAAPWKKHPILKTDPHFMTQVRSVHPRKVNYSKIYDLHHLGDLFADIHAHLKALGKDRELYVPRANESSLPITPETLTPHVVSRIRKSYRNDFATWGDRWRVEDLELSTQPWTDEGIRNVATRTSLNQRIGDLSDLLRATKEELAQTRRELAVARYAALPLRKRAVHKLRRELSARRAGQDD